MKRNWRSVSGYYHVTLRGVGKQLIFENDDDRWDLLQRLKLNFSKCDAHIVAWCLMGNHIHLVIADFDDAMSPALQRVLSGYARYFNRRTGRSGHLFQNRFDRKAIDSDEQLIAAIRYVHANPQRAGICEISQYRWSSFDEYLMAYDFGSSDGFSNPLLALSLWRTKSDFIAYSTADLEAQGTPMEDLSDIEFKRREKAEEIAKAHGRSLNELKTLVPAERDRILFALSDARFTTREVERFTGISRSTVSRAVKAYESVKKAAVG